MWGRASAGVVPGFFVAAALVGLVCWLLPGSWQHTLVPGLVAFFPVWVGVICAGFRFANGTRAWLWLSLLAVLGLGTLWSLQAAGWVR
jgi:multidrug efflux pump subunit AcrB